MTTPGEHRLERRLAAILAADVAGYSQRMGADDKAVGFTVPVSLLAPADEVIEGGSSSGQ